MTKWDVLEDTVYIYTYMVIMSSLARTGWSKRQAEMIARRKKMQARVLSVQDKQTDRQTDGQIL